MGKGIALECKKRYPLMFKCYTYTCKYLHGQEQNIKTTILNQGGDIYFWYNPKCNDNQLWGDLLSEFDQLHGGIILDSKDSKCILNFATKEFWRNPSKLEWIERGLYNFAEKDYPHNDGTFGKFWNLGPDTWTEAMTSIAWPKLGCSNGGLKWEDVKPLMIKYLEPLPIICEIYE